MLLRWSIPSLEGASCPRCGRGKFMAWVSFQIFHNNSFEVLLYEGIPCWVMHISCRVLERSFSLRIYLKFSYCVYIWLFWKYMFGVLNILLCYNENVSHVYIHNCDWILANFTAKKNILDQVMLTRRLHEEKGILVLEMAQHCTWLQNMAVALKNKVAEEGKLKAKLNLPCKVWAGEKKSAQIILGHRNWMEYNGLCPFDPAILHNDVPWQWQSSLYVHGREYTPLKCSGLVKQSYFVVCPYNNILCIFRCRQGEWRTWVHPKKEACWGVGEVAGGTAAVQDCFRSWCFFPSTWRGKSKWPKQSRHQWGWRRKHNLGNLLMN